MSGADKGAFYAAIILIAIPTIIFFSVVAPVIWARLSPIAVIIPAISIPFDFVVLFMAHFRDPGIIPRKKNQKIIPKKVMTILFMQKK